MKKFKIIFLFALSVSLFSCEDSYKIEQDGEFQESVTFLSVRDMQSYLNETYDKASILSEINFTAVFTDELGIGNSNAGQNIDLYKFFLNENEGSASSLWLSHYTLINYANRLIAGAKNVTPVTQDEINQYNSVLAQARALRAFGHFQLLSYFSEDLKNDNALGVILLDKVPVYADNEQLPRNTNAEVFAFIDADLAFAEANFVSLPSTVNPSQNYKYVSKNFINALKARMYLYRGKYDLASQAADLVINTSGITLTPATPYVASNFYSATATTNPYRRMFSDLDQGEIIFALGRRGAVGIESVASLFYFNTTNRTGGAFHDMGRSLFNILNETPGDVRRRAYVDPTSLIAADPLTVGDYKNLDILCIDKYPGKAGNALVNDLKVFRLSEMYFIKAEALANSGNLPGVAAILKQIRDIRNFQAIPQPLPVYASATEAWADILKERRVELAFEGHRYLDLKRLGGLANATIDRFSRDCEANNISVCSIPVTDHRFTLPIPNDELRGNSNIQQNTGY